MAPHHASGGKRPQNVKREKKRPEPRHSEPAITKNSVGSSSKTGSSPTTSRNLNAIHDTSHPQKIGTPSATQNLPPNSPPTTATTSSRQPLTTVGNVKAVHISGGTFVNSLETVVQYGRVPSERQPVRSEEIFQGRDYSLAVPDLEDIENGDTEAQSACQLTESNGKTTANSQPQIKDYDIYYRQLLLAGRGSPMWRPGPNMALPNEYRRNGIGIGDVGIIYRSEGFGFLFNIFLPADHPVNKGSVPDDFEPLDFGQVKRDLEKAIPYGRGHHLASSALRNVSGVDSSGLVFETFASEGAILIMPDGATTEDLFNHKLVEKYIAKNAQSWYTYIMEVRGRKVRNGDLRLVMGFDKVASWAIATFASSAGEQVRLEFKTNNSDQAASPAYTWNCVGSGSGRVGPHEGEMDGLREPNDAEFVLKNQTIFVRTLNFNLNGEAWNDLTIHEIRSSDRSSHDSGPPSSHQPPSSPSGGQSSSGSRESHSGQGSVNFQTAQFGLSVNQHPSNQINDLLLKKFPNAQIVITDDADWISVLTKEDIIFPSPEDLCARLLSSRKMREKDGVITFYDDRANSDDELTLTGERNLNLTASYGPPCHVVKDVPSMLNRQYGAPSIMPVVHEEDSQPNERMPGRNRNLRQTYNPRDRVEDRPPNPESSSRPRAYPESRVHNVSPANIESHSRTGTSNSPPRTDYRSPSPKLPPDPLRTPQDGPPIHPQVPKPPSSSNPSRPPLPGRKRIVEEAPPEAPPLAQKLKVMEAPTRVTPSVVIDGPSSHKPIPTSPKNQSNIDKDSFHSPLVSPPKTLQSAATIKGEPSSPEPTTPSRKLVTEACKFWPIPDNCRKSAPKYSDNRLAFAKEQSVELSKLGLKRTKAFFREDGLVIEWKSEIPVWNDTLLPESPPRPTTPLKTGTDGIGRQGSQTLSPGRLRVDVEEEIYRKEISLRKQEEKLGQREKRVEEMEVELKKRLQRAYQSNEYEYMSPGDGASSGSPRVLHGEPSRLIPDNQSIRSTETSHSYQANRNSSMSNPNSVPPAVASRSPTIDRSPSDTQSPTTKQCGQPNNSMMDLSTKIPSPPSPWSPSESRSSGPSNTRDGESYYVSSPISVEHNGGIPLQTTDPAIRAAIEDPNSIWKFDENGDVVAGTLEGLVQFLITTIDSPSPKHKVYRDIFSMSCAGVTTPDELFQIIARRLEQAKDSEASARALVERNAFLVIEHWLELGYMPSNKNLRQTIKLLCEHAIQSKSEAAQIYGFTNLERLVDQIMRQPAPPSLIGQEGGIPSTDLEPRSLAIALSVLEGENYQALRPLDYVLHLTNNTSDNIDKFYEMNNKIRLWVMKAILEHDVVQKRAEVLTYFIKTALECCEMRNISSATAIISALDPAEIRDLKATTKSLTRNKKEKLRKLYNIINPDSNYRGYWDTLELAPTTVKRGIPWLKVHLMELQKALSEHPVTIEEEGRHLINLKRYIAFMDRSTELLHYTPPFGGDHNQREKLECLLAQLRTMTYPQDTDKRLLVRSVTLRSQEISHLPSPKKQMKQLGFEP